MTRFFICSFLISITLFAASDRRIKHVKAVTDQIIPVKTAVGVATLIQLQEHPNSAIIGDQDSFKVEFLDKGITLKPLHHHARSNLYLYTETQRFNLLLTTGPATQADFVVSLEEKSQPKRGPIPWR